jgi:hypothetical protein
VARQPRQWNWQVIGEAAGRVIGDPAENIGEPGVGKNA